MKNTDSVTQKKNGQGILQIIGGSVAKNPLLAIGIVVTVCGAIVTALLPPIILGHIVDDLTAGQAILFSVMLLSEKSGTPFLGSTTTFSMTAPNRTAR